MAAEMTLFALLSVLPLLLVAAAGLGVVEAVAGVKLSWEIELFFERHITRILGENTPVLEVVRGLFADTNGTAITLGLLAAFYGASRVLVSLVGSLDVIYNREPGERRGWLGARAVGVGLAGVSIVAIATAILAIGAGGRIALAAYGPGWVSTLAKWTSSLFGYAFAVLYLAWLYGRAPRGENAWGRQIPGAVIAVAIGEASSRVLRGWFSLFDANAVFGSIGAVMALIWWTYIFASGIILGAEINVWRAEKTEPGLKNP